MNDRSNSVGMGTGSILILILTTLLGVKYGFLRVIITYFGRRLLQFLHLNGEEKRDIPIQSRDPPPAGFGNGVGDFIEKLNAARELISEGIVEVRRCGVDDNGNLKMWASCLVMCLYGALFIVYATALIVTAFLVCSVWFALWKSL